MKHWLRHPTLTLAVSAALALASGTAAALGLGQIEVRSRAGQPLLAEIPIISTTPGELDALQARLASPETFSRIGLLPPQGVVTDLRFDVTSDRNGRPIIRVTSERPIEQPLLTFLVEVDWGQGRLVREYSALIDTPSAVAAPVQPPIQAPAAAPSNTIQRPVAAPQRPTAPAPQRPAATEQAPAPAASAPGEYGPVRSGETLSAIAARLGLDEAASLDQAMIAMLRANPDAFIEGDINRLRRGAVLRVPAAAEVAAVDAAQASQIVRDRMRQWREARRQAVVDPGPAQAEAAPRANPAPTAAKPATPPAKPAAAPRAGADARLEIVPPAANRAAQAGTQSGQQAGGEGTMLQQELQQTRETLAARDAELQELKSRVAELEKLQTDQQRLLALRNEELAAAQKRLAAPAATAAPAAPTGEADGGSVLPWILGGAALLALVLAAWWARRRPSASQFRAPAPSAAADLASAFPSRHRDEDLLVVAPHGADEATVAPIVSSSAAHDDAADEGAAMSHPDNNDEPASSSVPVTRVDERSVDADIDSAEPSSDFEHDLRAASTSEQPASSAVEDDDWTGPDLAHEDAPHEDEDAGLPAWHSPRPAPVAPVEPRVAAPAPMLFVEPAPPAFASPSDAVADAPVNERIELAQAYLDLGDYDSARQLLGEVAVTGDHASKQRAMRMLREIE